MSKERRIAERILEAERLARRNRPERKRVRVKRWERTKCPRCGYEVKFHPNPHWDGTLRCPHCAMVFHVPRLDDFK